MSISAISICNCHEVFSTLSYMYLAYIIDTYCAKSIQFHNKYSILFIALKSQSKKKTQSIFSLFFISLQWFYRLIRNSTIEVKIFFSRAEYKHDSFFNFFFCYGFYFQHCPVSIILISKWNFVLTTIL